MLSKLLSDRLRFEKIALLFISIPALLYYGYLTGANIQPSYHDYIENAEYFDGYELSFSFERVYDVGSEHFKLMIGNEIVTVKGDASSLKKGDFISLKAVFKKEGFLELKELHMHKNELIVFFLSAISPFIVAFFFFKEFKFNFKKLLFEEK